MARSCRFAFAVHILAVLARRKDHGVTSDSIAASVNTNPVVIRRIISALRRAELVCCAKGAKGGATLCRNPDTIRLNEVYRAIEPPASLSGHPHQPNLRCPVGSKITAALEMVFASAQRALEASLAERTLADVIEGIDEAQPELPRLPARSRKAA